MASLAWVGLATAIFVAANGFLRTYAGGGGVGLLLIALALFCGGNAAMVPVMRAGGLGPAIALSVVFQLVAVTALAVLWFGERPTGLQVAGMTLGLVAVALIAWPTGGGA